MDSNVNDELKMRRKDNEIRLGKTEMRDENGFLSINPFLSKCHGTQTH
jgi:hypothetical protein